MWLILRLQIAPANILYDLFRLPNNVIKSIPAVVRLVPEIARENPLSDKTTEIA